MNNAPLPECAELLRIGIDMTLHCMPCIKRAGNPGKWVRIEEQLLVRTRSQHNYYWVYLEHVSRETGHTTEELHAWAKKMFLPRRFARVMDKEVELEPSTKTLSKVAFAELLDRICAETGVPLPNPQDAGYLGC